MTKRIVVHAGFHKTGTTSVQSMLRENAELLAPHVHVMLKEDFEELTEKARAFSIDPREKSLSQVAKAAAAVFSRLDMNDPRPLLLASEDLSGHMPGRHGLKAYDSAGLIMRCISASAYAMFGRDSDLTFYFSTRTKEAWLRSTWWQNLRSTRLTLDFDAYKRLFEAAPSFDTALEAIAQDVAPAFVTSQNLEEIEGEPRGPLDPVLELLDLTDLDRAELTVLPPANVQPDLGIDAVFLALNRSKLSDKDIQDTKRHVLKMARRIQLSEPAQASPQ